MAIFDKKNPPVLTEAEASSPLFKKIQAYANERIAKLRTQNDADLPADKTARLRGQIKELKNLAALDKPAPQTEADDFKD